MKLQGTGMPQSAFVSPFESMILKPYHQTVGAGIGVKRTEPGFRTERPRETRDAGDLVSPFTSLELIVDKDGVKSTRPKGAKNRHFDRTPLGETPPRDGPFASPAQGVAKEKPTRAIKRTSAVARSNKTKPGVPVSR